MSKENKQGFGAASIIIMVTLTLIIVLLVTYGAQYFIDGDIVVSSETLKDKKTEYEITKLDAEISRIRSDTAGSLFWLKLIALFVTVGGAVGGYLIGQSRTTLAKISFEDRKNVDEVYQSIVQELADESPILRAAAAVKLGAILKSFPSEWSVSEARKDQIYQLTKQVLAAALSIESDVKVLKTLSINLVLHKAEPTNELADAQALDLSGAKADDVYWARCDFKYSDFYAADLSRASFRKSDLSGAQYRETNLNSAVLSETTCIGTNFKMADLRGAVFKNAKLESVNFEDAKVYSVILDEAEIIAVPECNVDISKEGDGSSMVSVNEWLETINNDKYS